MMTKTPRAALLIAAAGGIGVAAPSLVIAGEPAPATTDFSLGVGYAHVSIGNDGALDGEDAWKFDPSLTFSLIPNVPQLRVGAAVGVVFVVDNSERTIISNNGQLTITGSGDIPLWLVEPELRLSWRQHLGDPEGLFIEPGVAAGWTFARLDIDDDDDSGQSFDESDTTFSTRVFLRVGARVAGGFAGIEGSWMRGGDLHLADNASGDVEEFYIGIFGALAF